MRRVRQASHVGQRRFAPHFRENSIEDAGRTGAWETRLPHADVSLSMPRVRWAPQSPKRP